MEKRECLICMIENEALEVKPFACKHTMCRGCAIEIRKSANNACPFCRCKEEDRAYKETTYVYTVRLPSSGNPRIKSIWEKFEWRLKNGYRLIYTQELDFLTKDELEGIRNTLYLVLNVGQCRGMSSSEKEVLRQATDMLGTKLVTMP